MRFPTGGVNQALNSALLPASAVADAVNCVIEDGMIGCRPGVVLHDLDVEGQIQGAIYYNPAEGQSQVSFGEDRSSLVLACGGNKYLITLSDEHPYASDVTTENVTGDGLTTNSSYHMVWMIQAENYVIAQDGNSETWIWDGETDPFFSKGYNSEQKEESKLANGSSALGYAHGRVVQCIGSNKLIVGDIIHKGDLSSAANILETTEQTYWATGSFFSPPSSMGPVQAISILPLQNTQHGHGDLIVHCRNGVYSLDVSLYPRSEWVDKAITKHVLLDTGAAGFYAVVNYDGDQMFFSRHGVQSLRSEASVNRIGNPFTPISEPVRDYIDAENHKLLNFASMTKNVIDRRMLTTTAHSIVGEARGGRGLLSLNLDPTGGGDSTAWEGLWTLPKEGYLIGGLTRGIFSGTERVFAFVTGDDGNVRLAEFSRDMDYDALPDGTLKPIEWQVMTRADVLGNETTSKNITNGVMVWRSVKGPVNFEVYARSDKAPWTLWKSGCLNPGDECCIEPKAIRDFRYDLGAPPQNLRDGLWIQLLVKASGPGFIETIRVSSSLNHGGDNRPSPTDCMVLSDFTDCDSAFNPFEYTSK